MLTRFAPAPTGWLHLGHVLNAELVWRLGPRARGRVLLRIEDHDRTRCRPEYEAGILDDLDWLGFVADIFPDDRVPRRPLQRADSPIATTSIAAAVETLRAQGLVYGCDCTRAQIASRFDPDQPELRYNGRCRDRGLSD